MKNVQYFFVSIAIICIIAGVFWGVALKVKVLIAEDEILVKSKQECGDGNCFNLLSEGMRMQDRAVVPKLSRDPVFSGFTNDDSITPKNNESVFTDETVSFAQKREYRRLLSNFTYVEGEEKILLMQKLWQLSPEVGIDEEFLTIIQLASYDSDSRIEKLAATILNDLQRFKSGVISHEQRLVSQIKEIDNQQRAHLVLTENIHASDRDIINNPASLLPDEVESQKEEKIKQLKELAIKSDNQGTKEYALINLIQIDQAAAQDVIMHQLLYSNNSTERFKVLEILGASIGEFESIKIRQILDSLAYDNDDVIAEGALVILKSLDDYIELNNNQIISNNNIENSRYLNNVLLPESRPNSFNGSE